MKNKFVCFLVFSLTFVGILTAQNRNNRFAIVAKANFIDNRTPRLNGFSLFNKDNFSETTKGGEIGFFRNINKFVNIGIPLRIGSVRVPTTFSFNGLQKGTNFSADLVAQIGYFGSGYLITPYILGGVGYQLETTPENMTTNHGMGFPVGAGLNFRLYRNLHLQAQTEYRFTAFDARESIVYGLGLLFTFNGKNSKPKQKDTDEDGIADTEDECPLLVGTMALKGCPDADDDKVADKDDDCPAETGLAKFGGCPDTDNDGVMDKEDECPTVAGIIELKGCPDADGDGVSDLNDQCPTEAGPASNAGCPVAVAPVDSDNDGVPDGEDRCPTNAGTLANNGCPEISAADKEILNLAVSNVEFESSRATLKTSSFGILDQIAMLMQKYPDYNLSINGHTDSVGGSKINQVLSERRAKSCYDYITQKGISASRMNYTGYGETQPIADNRFKDGREKNRRVEFNLFLK